MARPFSLKTGLLVMLLVTTSAMQPTVQAEASAAEPYLMQEVEWTECLPGRGFPFFECAVLAAPLDWADPARGEIQIAVSRVRATDTARRRGIVVTNPGGPGQPGLMVPLQGYFAEPAVVEVYDVIGMDVRGVGRSTRLSCVDSALRVATFAIDPRDQSEQNLNAIADLDRLLAEGCSSDPLAPYISTWQVVHDIDLVRLLLGESKISYLGLSAGTWLGAAYASQFPDRVDRFVLDGVVDFTRTWEDALQRQPRGFQRRFEVDFLPWIARYDHIYGLGPTATVAHGTYEARRAALGSRPLDMGSGVVLTPALYDAVIQFGLRDTSSFPSLAATLAIVERWQSVTSGEQAAARQLVARRLDATSDSVGIAVPCNDTEWTTEFDRVVRSAEQLGRKYPLLGWSWSGVPCAFWTLPFGHSPIDAHMVPPLLMVNSERDPATPIEGARKAREKTPGSVLLTVVDDGNHTTYAKGNPCVEQIVNDWLIDGRLPDEDVRCPGLPPPVPTTAAVS